MMLSNLLISKSNRTSSEVEPEEEIEATAIGNDIIDEFFTSIPEAIQEEKVIPKYHANKIEILKSKKQEIENKFRMLIKTISYECTDDEREEVQVEVETNG